MASKHLLDLSKANCQRDLTESDFATIGSSYFEEVDKMLTAEAKKGAEFGRSMARAVTKVHVGLIKKVVGPRLPWGCGP